MTTETFLEVLQSPLAAALEPQHVDKLLRLGREVDLEEDQTILHEGEGCDQLYLLLSGRVALEILLHRRVVCIQTLAAGDELGWSSVLMGNQCPFHARCVQRARAIAFDGPQLLDACKRDPAFGFALMYRLLEVVAGRLQATRLQLVEIFNIKAELG
jgi:CRP-like cAMP-binding protein